MPRSIKGVARSVRLAAPLRVLTSPLRMLPDFVIIGAMKCGTTSLYRHLEQHPQIAPARRKEVHYFDWYYDKGESWYRGQFPMVSRLSTSGGSAQRVVTGEASPYYLFHPHAPGRLKQLLPEARLIVLLRNPVDRAWSHYHHVRKRNGESLSFEEALEAEPGRLEGELQRLRTDPSYRSYEYQKHSYQARGVYADGLQSWMELFDRSRFLILRSEDFFADPPAAYRQTLDFLALAPHDLGRYENFLAGSYTSRMEPATRERLVEYFRPHNRRLEELLGREMDWDR